MWLWRATERKKNMQGMLPDASAWLLVPWPLPSRLKQGEKESTSTHREREEGMRRRERRLAGMEGWRRRRGNGPTFTIRKELPLLPCSTFDALADRNWT